MCFSTTEDGCSYGRNVLKKHQDFNRVSSSQFLPTKSVLSMQKQHDNKNELLFSSIIAEPKSIKPIQNTSMVCPILPEKHNITKNNITSITKIIC